MQKISVTSVDVAKKAKVSQSAVSRTFTPGASVSAKMREKVLQAAAELGYRPNAIARAMISGRSRFVAVMVAYLENQFYPLVLEKLSTRLQRHGLQVLLFMTGPGMQDNFVQRMLEFQVEGIVMVSATLSSEMAEECSRCGVPVVMVNRYAPETPASRVVFDNYLGGRMVAEFLARGNHERIAFVAGDPDSTTSKDREAGFRRGLRESGKKLWGRATGGYTFDGAADAARELLEAPEVPDAIFVANDHMAFSVMDVIRTEFGLRIPQDISVIGFDDVPEAGWKAYDLTSVAQSSEALIDETVAILLDQIVSRKVRQQVVTLPAEMVVRGSARLPANAG